MRKADKRTLDEEASTGKDRPAELPKKDIDMLYGNKAYKRTVRDTAAERDLRYARLHDWYHNKSVEMWWDLNQDAIERQLFRIKIGDSEVILSATELQKYLRWV
jgi:hypothetical protein